MTNLLACLSNQIDQKEIVENLISKYPFEKTYEFFFNYSQVQMKQQLHSKALESLLQAFKMAKDEGSESNDLIRFKV